MADAEKSKIVFTPVTDPVYVHPLGTPIAYGAGTIAEIAFRKPTGHDLLYVGSPVNADPTSGKDASLDFARVYAMASALSGIPEKVLIAQVDIAEVVDMGWMLGSFFMPGWQTLLPAMQKSRDLSSGQPEPRDD